MIVTNTYIKQSWDVILSLVFITVQSQRQPYNSKFNNSSPFSDENRNNLSPMLFSDIQISENNEIWQNIHFNVKTSEKKRFDCCKYGTLHRP